MTKAIFSNCLDLDAACELYFEDCDQGTESEVFDKKEKTVVKVWKAIPYTICGLAVALGMTRETLTRDYESRYPHTIKKHKARIEAQRNIQLLDGSNPVGKIFDLKNNFGWKDTRSQEHTVTVQALPDDQLRAQLSRLMADPDVQHYLEQSGEVLELPSSSVKVVGDE